MTLRRAARLVGDGGRAAAAAVAGGHPMRDTGWLLWLAAWRVVLPFSKRIVPLPLLVKAVRSTAVPPGPSSSSLRRRLVAEWFANASPVLPTNCLERSLLVHATWAGVSASTQLVFGFRRQGTAMQGHSWVISDGVLVLESANDIEGFTPASVFDGAGARAVAGS